MKSLKNNIIVLSYTANSGIKYGASVNIPFFFYVKVDVNSKIARGILIPTKETINEISKE